MQRFDTAIIGGGIVGMATAMALVKDGSSSVVVLEAEDRLAAHQSGHNSGVIHAGLYYRPGSLKTRLCVEGREAMYRFCAQHGIVYDRCGKVVVATDHAQMQRLDALEQRGIANGLQGVRRLDADGLREYEPHVAGVGGISNLCPSANSVSKTASDVARTLCGPPRCASRTIQRRPT